VCALLSPFRRSLSTALLHTQRPIRIQLLTLHRCCCTCSAPFSCSLSSALLRLQRPTAPTHHHALCITSLCTTTHHSLITHHYIITTLISTTLITALITHHSSLLHSSLHSSPHSFLLHSSLHCTHHSSPRAMCAPPRAAPRAHPARRLPVCLCRQHGPQPRGGRAAEGQRGLRLAGQHCRRLTGAGPLLLRCVSPVELAQ